MTYEVVFTMSRAATAAEWSTATQLVRSWLQACTPAYPAHFIAADIRIADDALFVELTGAEDLIVERDGTTAIWSVRTTSRDAARILSGVLLCLQYACSAETFQLSGSKTSEWQGAATDLTPVWDGMHQARLMTPRRHKADSLVYVDHAENALLTRRYFRAHLELDEHALPDLDFKDQLAD